MLKRMAAASVLPGIMALSLVIAPQIGYTADLASAGSPMGNTSVSMDTDNPYASLTTTDRLKQAREAIQHDDWVRASDCYLTAATAHKDCIDFWAWCANAAAHAKKWDVAAGAIEHIFEIDPNERKHLEAEYGEALYHLRRYDQASTFLHQALLSLDTDPQFGLDHLLQLADRHEREQMAVVEAERAKVQENRAKQIEAQDKIAAEKAAAEKALLDKLNERTESAEEIERKNSNNLKQAYYKSEGIVIAEYLGYQKDADIRYFHPPQANFVIEKFLKGPPLNKRLPLRWEFHDQNVTETPKGWKFSDDKMPEKGSKWILFLSPAVPKQGQFETYHGCYGRFPADDHNLDLVDKMVQEHSSI